MKEHPLRETLKRIGGGHLLTEKVDGKLPKLPYNINEVISISAGESRGIQPFSVFVDVVETGATMKQNGLEVVQDIMTSSTYLIANKNSYIAKKDEVLDIYEKINGIINT